MDINRIKPVLFIISAIFYVSIIHPFKFETIYPQELAIATAIVTATGTVFVVGKHC